MPDRKEGFVRRGKGVLPADLQLAQKYRQDAKEAVVTFDGRVQQLVIEELRTAFGHQDCRGHYIATDSTHAHVLLSWRDDRAWKRLRTGIKSSLTRRLNRDLLRRTWLSDGSSRKRVQDRRHFDHLVNEYLPSHRGWKWREGSEPFI